MPSTLTASKNNRLCIIITHDEPWWVKKDSPSISRSPAQFYHLSCRVMKYLPTICLTKTVTCSHVKGAPHNSPLSSTFTPSHFKPPSLLATLRARPKQFSNKLFAFVGIHFSVVFTFPFCGGLWLPVRISPPAKGIKEPGLTNPLKNASHCWDLELSEFGRRGPADSKGCHISTPFILNDNFRSCARRDLTFREKRKQKNDLFTAQIVYLS